jgi:hypothetical protein
MIATSFSSLCLPPITIEQYILRIFHYGKVEKGAVELAGFLMKQYVYNISIDICSMDYKLMEHRLILTCSLISSKIMKSGSYNNKWWAKMGGVTTKELMGLEIELLFEINYKIPSKIICQLDDQELAIP